MAIVKISDPNGADMNGMNGWFRWVFQKLIVDRINRVKKVKIDPNAAASSFDETDNDITLTIGKDVIGTGGENPPDDPTKTYVRIWHCNGAAEWLAAPLFSELGPGQNGFYLKFIPTDSPPGCGTFHWIPNTNC